MALTSETAGLHCELCSSTRTASGRWRPLVLGPGRRHLLCDGCGKAAKRLYSRSPSAFSCDGLPEQLREKVRRRQKKETRGEGEQFYSALSDAVRKPERRRRILCITRIAPAEEFREDDDDEEGKRKRKRAKRPKKGDEAREGPAADADEKESVAEDAEESPSAREAQEPSSTSRSALSVVHRRARPPASSIFSAIRHSQRTTHAINTLILLRRSLWEHDLFAASGLLSALLSSLRSDSAITTTDYVSEETVFRVAHEIFRSSEEHSNTTKRLLNKMLGSFERGRNKSMSDKAFQVEVLLEQVAFLWERGEPKEAFSALDGRLGTEPFRRSPAVLAMAALLMFNAVIENIIDERKGLQVVAGNIVLNLEELASKNRRLIEKAERLFVRACDAEKPAEGIVAHYLELLCTLGREEDAVTFALRVLQEHPSYANIWKWLVFRRLKGARQVTEAETTWALNTLELDPTSTMAAAALAARVAQTRARNSEADAGVTAALLQHCSVLGMEAAGYVWDALACCLQTSARVDDLEGQKEEDASQSAFPSLSEDMEWWLDAFSPMDALRRSSGGRKGSALERNSSVSFGREEGEESEDGSQDTDRDSQQATVRLGRESTSRTGDRESEAVQLQWKAASMVVVFLQLFGIRTVRTAEEVVQELVRHDSPALPYLLSALEDTCFNENIKARLKRHCNNS